MIYAIMAEDGGTVITLEASSAEMAYRAVACWYNPSTVVCVTDIRNGGVKKFSRKLDVCGNLLEIVEVCGNG